MKKKPIRKKASRRNTLPKIVEIKQDVFMAIRSKLEEIKSKLEAKTYQLQELIDMGEEFENKLEEYESDMD